MNRTLDKVISTAYILLYICLAIAMILKHDIYFSLVADKIGFIASIPGLAYMIVTILGGIKHGINK